MVEHGSSSEIIMCASGEPSVKSACLPPSAAFSGRQQAHRHVGASPLAVSPPAPLGGLHTPLMSCSTALRLEPVHPRSGALSWSMIRDPAPPRWPKLAKTCDSLPLLIRIPGLTMCTLVGSTEET